MARGDLSKQERYTSGVSYGESRHLGFILKAMQSFQRVLIWKLLKRMDLTFRIISLKPLRSMN